MGNLPGVPDNLTRGANGRYWVGLTKPRDRAADRFASWPLVRQVVARLPRFMWPMPPDYGHVLAFDAAGRILLDLQDPAARLPGTSGATEHDGRLYLQSAYAPALGILDISALPASRRSP
jgi:hypothetical protein